MLWRWRRVRSLEGKCGCRSRDLRKGLCALCLAVVVVVGLRLLVLALILLGLLAWRLLVRIRHGRLQHQAARRLARRRSRSLLHSLRRIQLPAVAAHRTRAPARLRVLAALDRRRCRCRRCRPLLPTLLLERVR